MATVKGRILADVELEMFYADVAEDFGRYGATDKVCPVCGKPFIFDQHGNSFLLRCDTDDCIEYSSRGF